METDMEEEPEHAVCPCPFAGVANHDCNYRVLCGYSSDENLGDGFIAFDGDTELFLRVGYDSKPSLDIVQKESVFLCKAENLNLNLERWLARVHSAIEIEGDFLLNVFYRPGPSLRQLRQFSNFKPFSYATVGRFSADIFNILHAVHKTNYLMCDIDDDMLYFDTNTRSLFLGEFASVCINPLGMKTSDLKWDGPAHLAPLRSHLGRRLTQSDELESTFYFIVSLIRQLPWQETSEDDMGRHKFEACRVTNKLLKMLPGQYSVMHKLIDETQKLSAECGHSKPIDDSVYKELANLALRIAQEEGGMKSMDDPFIEFEHEPTNAMKEESDEGFTFEPIDVENMVFGPF